jgi:Ca2+-transporting ATPase
MIVTLALGVMRMAKKNAIVKRLPSVESLGSVSVICADKTGTLTMNQMTINSIFTLTDGIVHVDRHRSTLSTHALQSPSVSRAFQIGSLCNNAHVNGSESIGQPMEIAILNFIHANNYNDERQVGVFGDWTLTQKSYRRLSEIPFDSEQKWMAIQYETNNGVFHAVKGAPEVILGRCNRYYVGDLAAGADKRSSMLDMNGVKALRSDHRALCESNIALLSSQGLRLIALAYGQDLSDLVFVGYVAMYDPPRPGVAETIGDLFRANVRVVMITGDSEGTAINIAERLGILAHGVSSERFMSNARAARTMSGSDMDKLSERQLQDSVGAVSVFYRTTPRHKLLIVKALQACGEVVAMTGAIGLFVFIFID